MTTVAVAGIRSLHEDSEPEVELAVAQVIGDGAGELRFGDARGSDEVALGAALSVGTDAVLRAVVAGKTKFLPKVRRALVEECSLVTELGLRPGAKWAYRKQAETLLYGADLLLAFTDGRETGGTWEAIQLARKWGVAVSQVPVLSAPEKVLRNPQIMLEGARAAIHGIFPYVSRGARGGRRMPPGHAWVTRALLDLEAYSATSTALDNLSRVVAEYVTTHSSLMAVEAVVPMPRREPGARNALAPLASLVAARLGKRLLEDWLVRVAAPTDPGVVLSGRRHFNAEAHAASLAVQSRERPASVLLLDDVVAYTGTMVGAQRAVERDTGVAPAGLAVTFVSTLPV